MFWMVSKRITLINLRHGRMVLKQHRDTLGSFNVNYNVLSYAAAAQTDSFVRVLD